MLINLLIAPPKIPKLYFVFHYNPSLNTVRKRVFLLSCGELWAHYFCRGRLEKLQKISCFIYFTAGYLIRDTHDTFWRYEKIYHNISKTYSFIEYLVNVQIRVLCILLRFSSLHASRVSPPCRVAYDLFCVQCANQWDGDCVGESRREQHGYDYWCQWYTFLGSACSVKCKLARFNLPPDPTLHEE